jgi:outer membrane biosynthesis protein TonB
VTTNDIAPYEAPGGVQIFDQARSSNRAMEQLQQHADAMSLAYDLAVKMCKTALVPSLYKGNAENGTAAILYGMELGLTPIQSLQQIFVVHGTPAIYARTMVALVMSHGHSVWTTESSDTSVTVHARRADDQRSGIDNVTTSTWTIERAAQAGYVPTPTEGSQRRPGVQSDWVTVTKSYNGRNTTSIVGNMKYITDPQAMLYAKAAAEVCRKIAPDILLGISQSAEDLQSETEPVQATASVDRPEPTNVGWQDRLGVTAPAPEKSIEPDPVTDQKAAEPKPAPETGTPEPPKEAPKKRATSAKAQAKPAEKMDEPPAEPASDASAEPEQPQAKPSYTVPKDAATDAQLKRLGELLDIEKLGTSAEKLEWINSTFTTAYINPKQMTSKQAKEAIDYLAGEQAKEAQQ